MQINRLFEILYILLDEKTVTAGALAERFEVSQRTIYRDIETLSSAGIPVYMSKGRGGGISVLEGFVLNKAMLSEQERSEILSSLQALGSIHCGESDTVLRKLGSLFGGSGVDWIEVDFSSWHNAGEEATVFHVIKSAILSRKILRFTYASGKGEKMERVVEPLKLCFKGVARYLYAYCTLREDFRFFKLTRMKDCAALEQSFLPRHTGQIFVPDEMRFSEQLVTLKLRLSPQMAFRVYDEFDQYTREDDGGFIAQIDYPDGKWLYPYIASFGSHCQVLEPLEVRNAVKEELQKTLQQYL